MEQLSEYMPYFTSIICALISGIVTYIVSRKQTKNEINKLIKQHELNLESQRKQYEHEIAILNLEHEHQLKLKDKELENKLSNSTDKKGSRKRTFFCCTKKQKRP